ncbi:MAG TPA: hypothetical protein ENO05_08785, partial [Bacteroides sp.]|nr:hypothetical protein [Bacteroides sp.]
MGRLFIFIILILAIAANCNRKSTPVSPEETIEISDSLKGISGLTYWNDRLWAHNDKEDRTLYTLNPSDGSILEFFELEATRWPRNEWEDIAQDNKYIYIGDMGNNERGNRRDLHILRIKKEAIKRGELIVDTISYSYSDQDHFDRLLPNTTRFD